MAVIWQKTIKGVHYKVVAAGASRRLYTNGVFHSQYNPKYPFNGSVWDLLAAPALMLDHKRPLRVLVLGVGGGAVVNILNKLIMPALTVGLDLDQVHLMLAKKHFHLGDKNTLLLHVDAIAWLKHYRGPKFDVVVDDLFGEVGGEPRRAIDIDDAWLRSLLSVLNPGGVLVANFESADSFQTSAMLPRRVPTRRAPTKSAPLKRPGKLFEKGLNPIPLAVDGAKGYTFGLPNYENVVAALYKPSERTMSVDEFSNQINRKITQHSTQAKPITVRAFSDWVTR